MMNARKCYIGVLFVAMLSVSCAHGDRARPVSESRIFEVIRDFRSAQWETIGPETVAAKWSVPIVWATEAHGELECEGTATFSYLGEVLDNECVYCDTFGFSDVKLANGQCGRALSSITIVRVVARPQRARVFGEQLLAAADGRANIVFTTPITTVTRSVSDGVDQTASVEVLPFSGAWRVRLLVYRVSIGASSEALQSSR